MTLYFDNSQGARQSSLQERAIREAYYALYSFAGAGEADHFVFTSSGAEGVNQVVLSAYLDITRKTGKNHFLCSALDEAPAIMALGRLSLDLGCVFQMVPADLSGKNSAKSIADMITPRTAMLSISWANALTGVLQPVREIAALCKERGILFHVDATHVLGKGDYSFEGSCADLLTFDPPYSGMGGLFIRSGVEISPLILGGGEQAGMRGGSFLVQSLLDCAKWAKEEQLATDYYCTEVSRLRSLFEARILDSLGSSKVLFCEQDRVCHITSLLFPGVASEALYFALAQKRVHATFGGGPVQHFSHLLKACKIVGRERYCALSFAFSKAVTQEEIERGADIIISTVNQLQKYSAYIYES